MGEGGVGLSLNTIDSVFVLNFSSFCLFCFSKCFFLSFLFIGYMSLDPFLEILTDFVVFLFQQEPSFSFVHFSHVKYSSMTSLA